MRSESAGNATGKGDIPVAAYSPEGVPVFSNNAFTRGIKTATAGDEPLFSDGSDAFIAGVQAACNGTPSLVRVVSGSPERSVYFSFFPSSDEFGPVALAVALPAASPRGTVPGIVTGDGDDPVIISDPDGRVLDVNEPACRQFRYSRPEMLGLRTDDLVAPLCRDAVPARYASLFSKGGGVFENLHVKRDGTVFPVAVHTTVIPYRGRPALVSVSTPIGAGTLGDETTMALREMEKKYRSFFDAAWEGFAVTGPDGVVLDINERFCDLIGQPKRAVIGRPLFGFFAQTGGYDPASLLGSAIGSGCVRFEADLLSSGDAGESLSLECCPVTLQGEPCIRVIARVPSPPSYEEEGGGDGHPVQYLSAFDSAGTGLVIIGDGHQIIRANAEIERMLGAPAGALRGRQWMDFVVDPSVAAVQEETPSPQGSGEWCIDTREIILNTTGGDTVPAVLSVRTIPGSGYSIASVQDISRQRETIGILSEHREMFERLFSSGCEAFIVLDEGYDIHMWNTAAEEMFGYAAAEVRGRNIFPLLFSCEPEEGERIFRRFLEPAATCSGRSPAELSLTTREGDLVHTEASVSRFVHRGHTCLLLIIRDNTERYQAFRSLTEHEEFLRFAIDAAGVGTWDYDTESDLIRMSEDVYEALSFGGPYSSPSGISADAWRAIIHPDDILTSESISLAVMGGAITCFEQELRLMTTDATWNWFALEGKVVEYDPTGRPRRVVGIIRDVQGKKQAESAIREANRKLGLLAGVTRHDILNQIQGLLFYSEEMKTGEYTVDEMVVMAGKIFEMTETVNRQITRTRNYDALGTEPPEWQNIHYLADEIVAGIDIGDLSYQNALPMVEVYADDLFADVLRTVVENAAVHARGATRITMQFSETGDAGIFTIEDDGCGVPAQYKEKIFSHGFSQGAGGGLFIARAIAEVTGIELCETGAVGSGARFELRIPRSGYRRTDTEGADAV